MRSRHIMILASLLILIMASQAFAATITPVPLKVPKGAYVNGGGTNSDDNFYWQKLTIDPAAAHTTGSTFTVTLPTGMYLADVNNDGLLHSEVTASWNDAGVASFASVVPQGVSSLTSLRFSLGDNTVTNGTFGTDATGWTLTNGVFGTNAIDLDSNPADATIVQDLGEEIGMYYDVIYNVTAWTAGNIQASIGGASGGVVGVVGEVVETIGPTTSTADFTITLATGANTATIDDIIVIPHLERNGTFTGNANSWVLNANWAYNANTALRTADATLTTLEQNVVTVPGTTYKLVFTTGAGAGTVTATLGGVVSGTAVAAATTATEYFTATSSGNLIFTPDAAFNTTIDLVSITPVHVADGEFTTVLATSAWTGVGAAGIAAGVATITNAGGDAVTQDLGEAAGEVYTVIWSITVGGGTVITPSIGGANGTTQTAVGRYIDVITAVGGGDLSFTGDATAGGATVDNVFVIKHSIMEAGDDITIMIPVETDLVPAASTDDFYIDFSDENTDDIANGFGTAITYVDPAYNAIDLVAFTADATGNDDGTGPLGDVFPITGGTQTLGSLPDLVVDGGDGEFASTNVGITLDGTEGSDETLFAVWVSTDSTLAHIDSLSAGVSHALEYPSLTAYLANETGTGNIQYATGGLPEGQYFLYLTSYLTGDFVLARSGSFNVVHWPVVDTFGYDRNHDGDYTPGGAADDQNTFLDSGSYFDYAGNQTGVGDEYTDLDLFVKVEDLDDNASISLFYSTSSQLDSTNVTISGAPADTSLAVTGLTGATLIKAGLNENLKDAQGYVKWTWETDPVTLGNLITATGYSFYAVACDGKIFNISNLEGNVATNLVANVKHSPQLTIDTLDEYDNDTGTAGYQINIQDHDTIMMSWGKTSGVAGDNDYDDSAVIEFYIAADEDPNTLSDYSYNNADTAISGLRAEAANPLIDVHQIAANLVEDDEAQNQSWYAWNLKADYEANGWAPTEGTDYFIFAVIDENKPSGTARVVSIGAPLPVLGATDLAAYVVQFTNSPFTRLSDPPKEGVTINAEQTYQLDLSAFDWDDNAYVGVFAVSATTGNYSSGVMSMPASALDSTGVIAYALTDDNGTLFDGVGTFTSLREDASAAFDLTIRTPGVGGPTYTTRVDGTATALADDTYWLYVGSAKEEITNKVTNSTFTGNTTGWTLGGNWLADGGIAITGGAFGATDAETDVSPIAGVTYAVQFDVNTTGATGGVLTFDIGGGTGVPVTLAANIAATVTYTIEVTAATTLVDDLLTIAKDGAIVTPVLDNISVVPQATIYRAPGGMTVVNSGVEAPQRNLSVSPMNVTVAQDDTVSYSIMGADNSGTIDRVDLYIAVEKDFWTLSDAVTPFDAVVAYNGMLLTNTVTDDAVNNRWILHTVISDGGNSLTVTDAGLGNAMVTFDLISKGTSVALDNKTSIYFVNEPNEDRVTKFSNNGADIFVNMPPAEVNVIPRAIIEGLVQLEGRAANNTEMTFELRERGSYEPIYDALFNSENDADANVDGVQFTPDNDGKFTFMKVPTGEYDFVVKYKRYLSKLVEVELHPGLDTLFVSFGKLFGGDAVGYTDSSGANQPDNVIDTTDIDRIELAFLATPDSSRWDDGSYNYKWADIDEDNTVNVLDLSMATRNAVKFGAQPYYKTAQMPVAINDAADFEFVNIPSNLSSGETFTIQVVGLNVQDARSYFINMNYDSSALEYVGIEKGDFINAKSHSFPVLGQDTVGLANSVYGSSSFSGDGVFAEITFISRQNGAFTANMLNFDSISLVNSNLITEHLLGDTVTGISAENLPGVFELSQNSPNPFNPTTTIKFSVPSQDKVSLHVYDILGRHVRTLVDEVKAPGQHSIVWDAKDASGNMVSAGIYFYAVKAGNMRSTKRMTLIK